MAAEEVTAELVQVVAQFPPRADAIITLLASDAYLPGAQTLMYSIQKGLDKNILYPPELVVLVTPDVSKETRNALWPALCTRIIEVELINYTPTTTSGNINSKIVTNNNNASNNNNNKNVQPWDDDCPGLTKLHAFRLEVYDTIIFIEPDCLVLDDLYPLIKKGKVYTEQEALVAAAPDLFPPDKFNSGVMVIRPNQATFDNMMGQRNLLMNYDGSDTGFLNAYFSEWHTEMAPLARLPFTWNAQRALYDMTYNNHSNYWDLSVSPDLKILHYSGNTKPWDIRSTPQKGKEGKPKQDDDTPTSTSTTITSRTGENLTDLWRQWYQRSKNFVIRFHKEKEKEEAWKANALARQKQQQQQQVAKAKATTNNEKDPKLIHKLVSKRFKQLRKEGHDVKAAMAMARSEQGLDDVEDPASAGVQVANMFGFSGIL